MKLRTRLLLGYGGFVLALAVLGAWSARTLSEMSRVSGRIIAENYDSVVAAQDMKESLERQDSAALFDLLGQRDLARRQAAEHRARFDAALARAAANITEIGEPDAIASIRRGRDDYYRRYDAFVNAAGDRSALYFGSLEPIFNQVRSDADRLLRLNQEAMRRKADVASQIARRWFFVTLGLALGLMAAGVAIEVSLSKSITGPVAQLTAATTRMAAGELDTAVPVRSQDEIGTLAVGFNRMAERIRELRQSDLGRLLVAQQTTEAAIDSLYDPVLVSDSKGRVTRINPAAERLFGARGDIVGKPIETVARDPRIAQAITDVLRLRVPAVSEDAAAVLRDQLVGDGAVCRQGEERALLVDFHHAAVAFDVGCQDGDEFSFQGRGFHTGANGADCTRWPRTSNIFVLFLAHEAAVLHRFCSLLLRRPCHCGR